MLALLCIILANLIIGTIIGIILCCVCSVSNHTELLKQVYSLSDELYRVKLENKALKEGTYEIIYGETSLN